MRTSEPTPAMQAHPPGPPSLPTPEPHRHEMLAAGLDMLDQGLTVFDADLRLVAWNRAFLRLLDFPDELAYVGAPFDSFIRYNARRGEYGPGDVEQQVGERVAAASAFNAHYAERERPGGQIIAVRGEPLPHRGFITLYTDITAQRRYEQLAREQNAELEQRVQERTRELQATTAALRRSEERLSLITDRVPALIGYFDRHQIYRYANQGYADWFGRSKDNIVGHPILEVIGERIYREILPSIERAIGGQQATYQYEMENREGRSVHARSMLVPEFDGNGEVLGCFVLSVNISEIKRAQAALVQAQKMEAVGQLTGGLAHDFNNLLTVVIGNLAALKERHPQDEVAAFLDPALKAAHRGAELIRRLLTFSRQQPLEPRPVDVVELVDDTVTLLTRSLPENIRISTHAALPLLFARTDAHQLENALLNLAFNARDAMPRGGQLHIEVAPLAVNADMQVECDVAPGSYVQLSVSDNGAGMDAHTAARAFEPFFTTKRFGSGSGLGLSMVYGFAKQSHGSARIQSEPGAGTTVRLLLPRCQAAAASPHQGTGAAIPAADRRPLVLLVEDDADVRAVVRNQLTDLGYPVLEAQDSEEAQSMLHSVPDIGILVSDIVIPGDMNGREVGRLTRERYPHIRVVLISGYADDTGAAPEPALYVLKKPFTKAMLQAALDTEIR
ncbi:PAS-domain containing protein [Noviherbaspirillum sp. UKPF54]|uniref:PAS-domain containing protein n=1 Tax=Noviherbaspirillum sp. UKPF54 TaxID=2601898 RepID=UPI001FED905B|nr:PAS-domain containing protein [Noviherbaspirillum sp. UKPF54]